MAISKSGIWQMTPKQSQRDDSEKPVKYWELSNVQSQVDQHERLIPRIEEKLDTIVALVQSRPTMEQVNDKINAASIAAQAELKNAIEKQDLKYEPIVNNNKWLLRAVLGTGITLVGSLVILILSTVSK